MQSSLQQATYFFCSKVLVNNPMLYNNSMPNLKSNPTLCDYQQYVSEMIKERGFTENTVLQNSLMLGEEVGGLFKAIRKAEKMRTDDINLFGLRLNLLYNDNQYCFLRF
jgi:hypothetical protein